MEVREVWGVCAAQKGLQGFRLKEEAPWYQHMPSGRKTVCRAAPPEREQQVEGGDSPPLLCSGEDPPCSPDPALGQQHKKNVELLEKVQRRP